MSGYGIVLFVHLCALIAAFAAAALAHFAEGRMCAAKTIAEVRSWASLAAKVAPTFPIALLILIGSGAYMVQSAWAWNDGWIVMGLAGAIAMMLNGGLLIGSRSRQLKKFLATAGEGPVGLELARLVHDPVLHGATWTNLTLALGVVLLMATKPSLAISIVVLVVAVAAGPLVAMLFHRKRAMTAETAVPESTE
jgi:hypothetical protein